MGLLQQTGGLGHLLQQPVEHSSWYHIFVLHTIIVKCEERQANNDQNTQLHFHFR